MNRAMRTIITNDADEDEELGVGGKIPGKVEAHLSGVVLRILRTAHGTPELDILLLVYSGIGEN